MISYDTFCSITCYFILHKAVRALGSLIIVGAMIMGGQVNAQDICERIEVFRAQAPQVALDSVASIRAKYTVTELGIPVTEALNYLEVINTYRLGNYDKAIQQGRQYLDWLHSMDYNFSDADYLNTIGSSYYRKGELDSAALYYVETAEALRRDGKNFYHAAVLNNIGVIFLNNDDYGKALEYYARAEKSFVEQKDSSLLTSVLGNMSYCYYEIDSLVKSEIYAHKAIQLGKQLKSYDGMFNGMLTLASIIGSNGDVERRLSLTQDVYAQADSVGYHDYKHRAGQILSQLTSDPKKAIRYADEAYRYSIDNATYLESDFRETYAQLLHDQGESKRAYELLDELYLSQDSIINQKYIDSRVELLTEFETLEKELKIAEQQQEMAEVQSRNTKLIAGIIFSAIGGLLLLALLYQNKKVNQAKMLAYQAENEKRFAQLETMILKSQMNPHFIFNSLNSIRYLFMKDQKDKGLKYITKFAKLLRSTLHHGEQALVPLSEEVSLTELYIDLEQLRFDGKFTFIKDYENTNWENIPIPPFVLQPLVENAFWHGLSSSSIDSKQLHIKISSQKNIYTITIEDNGVGFGNSHDKKDASVGKKKSYGLTLIKERFDLINKTQNRQYIIDVYKSTLHPTGTKVIITIKES